MKGCLTAIGGVTLLFLIVVAGIVASGSRFGNASSDVVDFSTPKPSSKHGWITAPAMGNRLDFWDDPSDECNAIDAGAAEIIAAQEEGRDVDTSVVERISGHHDIAGGTRVDVLGHASGICHGSSTSFTRVRVFDPDSDLNGRIGYIIEGRLSHQ